MTTTIALPAGFSEFAPFAKQWGRATENDRSKIRWGASAADFASFYAAVMPRLSDILQVLANCALDGMDQAHINLFNLAAAFAEAAPHHELYGGSADVPFSFAASRFQPGHGDVPSTAAVVR